MVDGNSLLSAKLVSLEVVVEVDSDVDVGAGAGKVVFGAGGAAGLGQFGGQPAGALPTATDTESLAVPPPPLHEIV